MRTNAIRKTLAVLLSVVLALPVFIFSTFADDTVFTKQIVRSDAVEPGQTWYNLSQLKKDTANDHYKSADVYLSEDGNTLKIEYTADAQTQTELHDKAAEPQYFTYFCVLPEFGDPLPFTADGLEEGDYWFDKDNLVAFVRSYGMQEEYIYLYEDAVYRLSVDGAILRKTVTISGTTFTTNSDEFLDDPSVMCGFLHQVGVDPNAGFILLPTSDEGLADGDYWFDVETLASSAGDDIAQYYRTAQYYLSEDGSTLRMVAAGMKMEFEKGSDEGQFIFAYVHQVGVDPNAGFTLLPTSDEGLADGDYWFDVESLATMAGEEGAQYYRDGQYYLSDDSTTLRVALRGYTQDYTKDDDKGGSFYFGFLHQVGVDPNAGFTLLPYSPEGLEDGDYWFDVYTLAEVEKMSDEDLEEFLAVSAIYISDDGLTLRFTQGGYSTDMVLSDPDYAEITMFLHRVGEDPNEGFTKLPTSEDGLRFGDYWYDAAGLAAAEEDEGLLTSEYYLSDDRNTIRVCYAGIRINVSADDEETGALVFGFLHRVGDDTTKAYLTMNTVTDTVYTGDTVQVTVDLSQNPGLAAMALSLSYDDDVLTLTKVDAAGMLATANLTVGGNLDLQPYNILWDDATSDLNHTETGTILTLTFAVKDNAVAGETAIILAYDAESTFDVDLQNVAMVISGASVTILKHMPGDADSNGDVNLVDVAVLTRYLADGWYETVDERNSDVNADGVLDLKDVVLIRRFLAGWEVVLV